MPDTATALAKVSKPGGPMRALARAFVQYRVVTRAPEVREALDYRGAAVKPEGSLASPDVLQQAVELGLRFVGVYAYLGLFGWIPREGWVTEDGAVRVSARRGKAGLVEGRMSSYYLSTTFDDGSVLLTWAKSPPPLASRDRVDSRGGTGNLTADLGAHRAAIEVRASRSPDVRPLPATTVDDCVAFGRYYDRFLSTDEQLSSIVQMRVIGWGGLAAVLAFAIWELVRFLHR